MALDSCTRRLAILAVCAVAAAGMPGRVAAQTRIFAEETDAVARALMDASTTRDVLVVLSSAQRDSLAARVPGVLVDTAYVLHEALENAHVVRRAVKVEAIGQYEPITFMVGIGVNGEVERVEVLVYRESRGGEVRRRAFLDQFVGKTVSDTIELGDGIMHITGATISSRAVARGVRLALLLDRMRAKQ